MTSDQQRPIIADTEQLRAEFEGLYDALLAKGDPVDARTLALALNGSFGFSEELRRELRIDQLTRMFEQLERGGQCGKDEEESP